MKWSTMLVRSIFVLGVCLAVVSVAPFTADAAQATAAKDKTATAGSKAIRVVGVKNHNLSAEPNMAGLGDKILVTVENIAALAESAKDKQVILFLDGMPIKKLYPEVWNTVDSTIRFKLIRADGCKAIWDNLLGSPNSMTKPVSVSLGVEDGQPVPTVVDGDRKFNLIVMRPNGLFFWSIVLIVILLAVFFWLAPKTAVLRNYGHTSPYSLALVQMAWWSILIFIAFIFLWLITGSIPDISGSSLTLLGIGAGTALGARMIDEGKLTKQLNALLPQKEEIEKQLKDVQTGSDQAKTSGLKQSLEKIEKEIAEVRSAGKEVTSRGFWNDILNDANGMSIHRCQIAVWTFILGIMFGWTVYRELAMPQMNDTLLALVGISSGTYLGFKFPESVRLSNEASTKKTPA
jgi:hypothetical protein